MYACCTWIVVVLVLHARFYEYLKHQYFPTQMQIMCFNYMNKLSSASLRTVYDYKHLSENFITLCQRYNKNNSMGGHSMSLALFFDCPPFCIIKFHQFSNTKLMFYSCSGRQGLWTHLVVNWSILLLLSATISGERNVHAWRVPSN